MQNTLKVMPGYQIENVDRDQQRSMTKVIVAPNSFGETFVCDKDQELKLVFGETLQVDPLNSRDLKVFINKNTSKLVITS